MGAAGDSSILFSLPAAEAAEAEPPERLAIAIVRQGGDWSAFGPLEGTIHKAAQALSSHRHVELPERSEASIVLGSDALVRGLNRSYRGKDAPTNVLSFPFQPPKGTPGGAGGYLGDVVLAAETIRKEAAEGGMEPGHHLQHLVVHGLLHLLGYDHDTEAAAEEMEAMEGEILAAIGVGSPHASPSPDED